MILREKGNLLIFHRFQIEMFTLIVCAYAYACLCVCGCTLQRDLSLSLSLWFWIETLVGFYAQWAVYTKHLLTDLHWYYCVEKIIFHFFSLIQSGWNEPKTNFTLYRRLFAFRWWTNGDQIQFDVDNLHRIQFGFWECWIKNKIEIDLLSLLSFLFLVKHTDTPLTVRKPIPLLTTHPCSCAHRCTMKIYTKYQP